MKQLSQDPHARQLSTGKVTQRRYKIVVQAGDAFTQSMIDEGAALKPPLEERGCSLEVIGGECTPDDRVAQVMLD